MRTPQSRATTRPSSSASRTTRFAVSASYRGGPSQLFRFKRWRAHSCLKRDPTVVTKMSYLSCFFARFREINDACRAPGLRDAAINARGCPSAAHRCAKAPCPAERRHPQSLPKVAETRSPGKLISRFSVSTDAQ